MKAAQISTDGEVIAIDGKKVRGSFDKQSKKNAIHMVSASATARSPNYAEFVPIMFTILP
jgi:hypothetical protein